MPRRIKRFVTAPRAPDPASVDLLSQQENEKPARAMPHKEKYPNCFVCKEMITEGQTFYTIINNTFMKRHTTCARKSPGVQTDPIARGGQASAMSNGGYGGGRVIRSAKSL